MCIRDRYEVENTGTATYSPRLAHWGTSVIMDGKMEDDKAYFFSQSSDPVQPSGSVTEESYNCILAEFVDLSETAIDVKSKSSNFPTSGQLTLPGYYGTPEVVSFTGASGGSGSETLTVTRAQNGTTATYHRSNSYCNGSSESGGAIAATDGRNFPLLSIRLAPSVDNAVAGQFGEREVINRMQMQLKSLDIVATQDCTIELLLNGRPSNSLGEFVQNIRPSISQYLKHDPGGSDVITGGDAITTVKVDTNRVTLDLSEVATLGNSIIGGNGIYPEGPDLLTILCRIDVEDWTSGTDEIYATLNWMESQA